MLIDTKLNQTAGSRNQESYLHVNNKWAYDSGKLVPQGVFVGVSAAAQHVQEVIRAAGVSGSWAELSMKVCVGS